MKTPLSIILIFSLLMMYQVSQAQTKYLWATAATGGTHGFGTILQADSDGTNFHVVYSFDSTNGSYPIGKMVMAGNGKMYIITELGGVEDSCTICTFDPVTQTLTKIYDFMNYPESGAVPYAGVIEANNGKLYGMTLNGGLYSNGVIYTIDPANDSYTDVYNFDTISGSGSELLQANDGKLYAVTQSTDVDSIGNAVPVVGTLFSFDPIGNNLTIVNKFQAGYGPAIDNYTYNSPTLIQASDNKIYGTVNNVSSDSAILFSYDIATTAVSTLYNFSTFVNGIPVGGLVQAGNGKLYGATMSNNENVAEIYSYDITTGTFNTVIQLDSSTGFQPTHNMGKLGNGKLVFSTMDGGSNHQGALISFDISNNTYSIMFSFDSATTGSSPICDILEASESVSGITKPVITEMNLYPNPANSTLYLSNTEANTPYAITNLLGQQFIKGVTTNGTSAIDISSLPNGMYFINHLKFLKE